MSVIIKSEMISRRNALSRMGLAAAFGLAAAPTVLTLRPPAWSGGVRSGARRAQSDFGSGAQRAQSGVRSGAQRAQSDVRSGARVQLSVQVPLPAQVPGR
jgi:hypothetical protein